MSKVRHLTCRILEIKSCTLDGSIRVSHLSHYFDNVSVHFPVKYSIRVHNRIFYFYPMFLVYFVYKKKSKTSVDFECSLNDLSRQY